MTAFRTSPARHIAHAPEVFPYTTEEVARLSTCTVHYIGQAAHQGEIPGAEKEDGRWVFRDRVAARAWAAIKRMSAHRRTQGGR